MAGKNGGARPGAGRPRKQVVAKSIDVAAQVLDEVDAKSKWKALLACGDAKVIADVMKYLTNRVYGCPTQIVAGDSDKPLRIEVIYRSAIHRELEA